MYIENATYAFRISGQPMTYVNFGHGHINHTLNFKITTDSGRASVHSAEDQ